MGIASRYLDNVNGNNDPLQPSARLKTVERLQRSPSKLQKASDVIGNIGIGREQLSPVKRNVQQRDSVTVSPSKLHPSPFPVKTDLQKSLQELKLDSPSPLKHTSKPESSLKSQLPSAPPPPQWTISNRKSQKGYEYLCRIGEAKEWIEKIVGEEIPAASELANDALRDGVILAKLTKHFKPDLVKRITPSGARLQFKHTENINVFFQFLDYVHMPDLFRFELTDLYDKKNIPRVIFCVHALSFMLAQDNTAPVMEALSGRLDFTDEEIKKSEGNLAGVNLPNFDSMNKQFGREIKPAQKLSLSNVERKDAQTEAPLLSPRKSNLENPFLDKGTDHTPVFPKLHTPTIAKTAPKELARTVNQPSSPLNDEDEFTKNLVSSYNRSPSKRKTLNQSDYLKNIIRFQAISRGSIFRYSMFVDRIMLKSMVENIVQVQSLVRRSLARGKYSRSVTTINEFESSFISFQSLIRGKKQRNQIKEVTCTQSDTGITALQSICCGHLIRKTYYETKVRLLLESDRVTTLQAVIRRNKIHSRTKNAIQANDTIVKVQSAARRSLFLRKINVSVREAHSAEDAITILQSVIRGNSIRLDVSVKLSANYNNAGELNELQAIARGGLLRNRLNSVLDTIDYEYPRLSELAAIAKGKALRTRYKSLQHNLSTVEQPVTLMQAHIRGVLSRFGYDLFLDNLEIYIEETIALQSSIRGYLYRQSKREVMKYYEDHLPAIIKIQSFIRGKYLGNAYKSLISMENPPLSVIRRFAYLLNDNDVDIAEEVNLTRIKESINEKTISNENLEKHIGHLDLKIALLQKNKITLDELLLQKNTNFKNTTNVSTIDVTSLNRRAKTRMESYEKLFYLLQTQPMYLTRLIHSDYRGVDVALKIFSDLQSRELPTREEYLFIRLIEGTLKDFIMKSHSVEDLQKRPNLGWQKLLKTFNETQKTLLQDLFGQIVEGVIADDELTFESDPVLIYKAVHNTPKTLPVEKAIEDPETKNAFITNLQQLREYGSEIYRIINDNIDRIPSHIKVLAKSAYKASMKKFPQNIEQEHLANAGYVIINGFINSILDTPKLFQISPVNESELYQKNLLNLSQFLTQLFLMKPFGTDQIYLQPLNKFIYSSVDGVRSLIKSIIDVGEIDAVYNMSVYDDITAHNRPSLTLRISDMLSIDELIKKEIDTVAPLADDTLREVIVEIQSNNASDVSKLHGYYTLHLNPSSYTTSFEDTRVKSLFMQAKRCVLYLIQVQDDSADLYDLLRSKINPIHEIKFKQIISRENKDIEYNRVNEYVNDGQGFLGDLSTVTYHKLKQLALERILELEAIGRVSRKNSFQILLNEIAYDIRTKHDQRLARKKQLSIAENTLIRLDEKFNFLNGQLSAYNVHIDKSMEELQSKPTKQKRILPFTKQFFYERELKKAGKLPKFGAYKYSSKRLYEKGILIELRGLNQDLGSSGSSFFPGFNFPKIDFMFNCDKAGVFTISSKSGTLAVNGSLETLTIDQLLEYQFDNKSQISLFDGMAKFDTNCLINFIFKKFYHSE